MLTTAERARLRYLQLCEAAPFRSLATFWSFSATLISMLKHKLCNYTHILLIYPGFCCAFETTQVTHFKHFNEKKISISALRMEGKKKIIKSPHILIAHAFSLDGIRKAMCTYLSDYRQFICHLREKKKSEREITALKTQAAFTCTLLNRTGPTGSS